MLGSSPEEAYRELQVLQAIRADYPGLADAIYRAEIATGIRQPPPDPQKLAQARLIHVDGREIGICQGARQIGPMGEGYLRLTFTNSLEAIERALEALGKALGKLQAG